MLNTIIESSLNNRFFVLMATLLVAGVGVYSALHLPIDAVPDLTNVQVQVITEAPALSPTVMLLCRSAQGLEYRHKPRGSPWRETSF